MAQFFGHSAVSMSCVTSHFGYEMASPDGAVTQQFSLEDYKQVGRDLAFSLSVYAKEHHHNWVYSF